MVQSNLIVLVVSQVLQYLQRQLATKFKLQLAEPLVSDLIDTLEKGDRLDVSATGDSVQDGTANVLFLGTKIKINGFNSSTTGAATNNDSEATGSFKVVKYDSETKELKFTINAKVSPWTQTNSDNSTEVVTKAAKLIAVVVVTLP